MSAIAARPAAPGTRLGRVVDDPVHDGARQDHRRPDAAEGRATARRASGCGRAGPSPTRNTTARAASTHVARLSRATVRCAFCTDAWASASLSLSNTVSWPKSSGRSRPVADSSSAICSLGSPTRVSSGTSSWSSRPRPCTNVRAAGQQRQQVDGHRPVLDRDAVDQAVTGEQLHQRRVGPFDGLGEQPAALPGWRAPWSGRRSTTVCGARP